VLAAVILGANAPPPPKRLFHAAVPARPGILTIVLGRDYGDGNSYTLIQRVGARMWRATWSSAYVGC